jgi:hypothetical protein
MAMSKEELLAKHAAVRAAALKSMSPQQRSIYDAAQERKSALEKHEPRVQPEFEASIERSLARFTEALQGVERHHGKSWLESTVCQDFAALFDEIRGVRKAGA